MTFPQAIASGFANYANFKGRATRSEFWWWVAFCFLAALLARAIDGSVFTSPTASSSQQLLLDVKRSVDVAVFPLEPAITLAATLVVTLPQSTFAVMALLVFLPLVYGSLGGLFLVALLLPSVSVATRRMHDRGCSGWRQLLPLVPLMLAQGAGTIVPADVILASVSSSPTRFVVWAGDIFAWAILLFLFARPGTPGPNRYGEPAAATPP